MLLVENLNIYFPDKINNLKQVVKNLSFNLSYEKLGLVGASGSGKSLTAKALLGLVTSPAIVKVDRLVINQRIALITQDPKAALNPVIQIGWQIVEGFKLWQKMSKRQSINAALELLREVNFTDPKNIFYQYPHQLSGGMAQRVLIAVMLACDPQILIADEATSALDPVNKLEILALLNKVYQNKKIAMLIISHDLPLVAEFCQRIMIMQNGEIIDHGNVAEIKQSAHTFTKVLWQCLPNGRKKADFLAVE